MNSYHNGSGTIKLPQGVCSECVIEEEDALGQLDEELIADKARHGGDPEYLKLLDELRELHASKSADYGSGEDPLANLRATAELGVPPWLGCMVRVRDKFSRVCSLVRNGRLRNEPIEDNLKDMAVYCLLALKLYREMQR